MNVPNPPFNPMQIGLVAPDESLDMSLCCDAPPGYFEKLLAAVKAAPHLSDDSNFPDPEPLF